MPAIIIGVIGVYPPAQESTVLVIEGEILPGLSQASKINMLQRPTIKKRPKTFQGVMPSSVPPMV
jgi:hypothetical protein